MGKTKMEKGVTLIAANTRVRGDIQFEDELYVNGHVEGNIFADVEKTGATVVVAEEGSVAGEIQAPVVVINGRVEGNVNAMGKLELAAKARVTGNVYYKLIEMQLGARVEGQLVHDEDRVELRPEDTEDIQEFATGSA